MGFVHGKGVEVLYGGAKLTSFFNDVSVSRNLDTAETSAFGDDAKTYVLGMEDGTLSLSGMFDGAEGAVDDTLRATIGAASNDAVTVAPEGLTVGLRAFSAGAKQTTYDVSSPIGDVVSVSLDMQADSGIDRGILLAADTSVTSSGENASQDGGAASSDGGSAYLHVTANTRDGASTFKVQSSADNLTWADLTTLASVPATTTTGEKKVLTGSVPRYLRASHTPGGSSGSITYTLTFARN